MRILLLGASGFIGSALGHALLREGHEVIAFGRDLAFGRRVLPCADWVEGDLRNLRGAEDWAPLLSGVGMIVNSSGALQTGLRDNVGQVQEEAILALTQAAASAGIPHMIQISAAGADNQPASPFMATKARADAALVASALSCTILRPGLVIGRNGFGGTELLRAAAGMPAVHVELGGTGAIQTIALADLVEAVLRIVREPSAYAGRFDLVERDGRSLGQTISLHRDWLGFAPAPLRIAMPAALLRPVSIIADGLGWLGWRSPLRSNSIAALLAGVSGDARETERVLGRAPLALSETLSALGPAGKADRWHARLALLYPLALVALMLLWFGSGLLGLLRSDNAIAYLVDGGMARAAARYCVIGGSVADLAIGLGLLFRPTLPSALKAGAAIALFYLAGSIAFRPDLWLDPLGPLIKVIPIVILTLICLAMSGER